MKIKPKNYSTTNPAVTQLEKDNRALSRRAAAEGMVLLKNENNLLPLAKGSNLALYGSGASQTIKGGTGSGDVNERERVSILQGLEQSGFVVTTKRWTADYDKTYEQARQNWKDMLLGKARKCGLNKFVKIYFTHPFSVPDGRPINDQL